MNFQGPSQYSNLRVSKSHNAHSEGYTESALFIEILPILFSFPIGILIPQYLWKIWTDFHIPVISSSLIILFSL